MGYTHVQMISGSWLAETRLDLFSCWSTLLIDAMHLGWVILCFVTDAMARYISVDDRIVVGGCRLLVRRGLRWVIQQ